MNTTLNPDKKITWSALEYEEKERTDDWFWALGIIIVTSSIASIIFENYFFAVLLVLAGVLLGFFATKNPEMLTYELNVDGLVVRNRLYPYENIKSFWVQVDDSPLNNIKPLLFIHSERIFMPVITIPIQKIMAEDIHSIFLSQEIPEIPMKEHPSEKIMEILGF